MFLNPADAPKLLHPKCRSPQLHTPRIGYEEAASPTRTLTLNRKPQTPKPLNRKPRKPCFPNTRAMLQQAVVLGFGDRFNGALGLMGLLRLKAYMPQ